MSAQEHQPQVDSDGVHAERRTAGQDASGATIAIWEVSPQGAQHYELHVVMGIKAPDDEPAWMFRLFPPTYQGHEIWVGRRSEPGYAIAQVGGTSARGDAQLGAVLHAILEAEVRWKESNR